MIQDDDRLLRALAELPPIAPDVEWEARVRARCHSAISMRVSRRARAGRDVFATKLSSVAAAAVLCVYWAAVLMEAARLGG
jgi:hypothetical protein